MPWFVNYAAIILTFSRMITFVSALAKNHTRFNEELINLCWKLIDTMIHELCLLCDLDVMAILIFSCTCTFVSALAKNHRSCLLQMKY